MKKAFLFVCFVLFISGLNAQEIEGVWFAGKNLRIDKYAGVDEFKTDSIYGVEGSILDFISNDAFLIKALGEDVRRGHYSIANDTMVLEVDEFQWKALVKDDAIKLTLIDSVDYSLELFYNKLKPSEISKKKLLDSLTILGSNWGVALEDSRLDLNFKEKDSSDVINKPTAFISNISEELVATEKGNYLIDSYKNHLFLYLLNKNSFEEYILRFDSYVNDTFRGELFKFPCPQFNEKGTKVQFSEKEKVTKEIDSLQQDILGRYQLRLLDLDKNGQSESLKTVIAYLELNADFTMNLDAYVTEIVDDVTVLRKLEKRGVWEFDVSQQFVTLNFDDGMIRYLTIQQKEELQLYLNRSPWPVEEDLNVILEFKKQ